MQNKLDSLKKLYNQIVEQEDNTSENPRQLYLNLLNHAVNIGLDCITAKEEITLKTSVIKETKKLKTNLRTIVNSQPNQTKSNNITSMKNACDFVTSKQAIIDFFITQIRDYCTTHDSPENKKLLARLKKTKSDCIDPQVFLDRYSKIYLNTLPDDIRATAEIYLTALIKKAKTYHTLARAATDIYDFCIAAIKFQKAQPSPKQLSTKYMVLGIKQKRQNIFNLNLILNNFIKDTAKEIKQHLKKCLLIQEKALKIEQDTRSKNTTTVNDIIQEINLLRIEIKNYSQELSDIQNKIRASINPPNAKMMQQAIQSTLNSNKKETIIFSEKFAPLIALHIEEESKEIQTALDNLGKHLKTLNDLIDDNDAPKSEQSDSTSTKSKTSLEEKSIASRSAAPLRKNSFAQISTQLKVTAHSSSANDQEALIISDSFHNSLMDFMDVSSTPRSNKTYQNPLFPSALRALGYDSDTEVENHVASADCFDESLDMNPDEENKAGTTQPSRFFF